MSKKGQVQQLQTDITTDEDLFKFVEKDGLLLLEVYTGWCGPCISMLASLKKIKLEKGGEDLILATVRADNVDTFKRLQNKSEPTWLLAVRGKLVDGMFGSNVPKLMKMISDAIDAFRALKETGQFDGPMLQMTQMVPCEEERFLTKKAIDDENSRLEFETAAKRRVEYITYVLDEIEEHLVDLGVTVMMPHTVSKDVLKQLPEHGEKFGLTPKDKKLCLIRPDDLEILHFECANPMPPFMLDILATKEAYMVAWKNADYELEPVHTIIRKLVELLTLPQPIKGDFSEDPVKLPPILKALQTEIGQAEYDTFKGAEAADDAFLRERVRSLMDRRRAAGIPSNSDVVGEEEETKKTDAESTAVETTEEAHEVEEEAGEEQQPDEEEQQPEEKEAQEDDASPGEDGDKNDAEGSGAEKIEDMYVAAEETDVSERMEAAEEEEVEEQFRVEILPIWSPLNARGQAALVYLYFRNLTDHFLPPDPTPDPPHVAVIFDAIKRNDLMAQFDIAQDDILAYGYFTSETPTDAKLLASSTYKYDKIKKKAIGVDRLVVKVSKKTSNTLLALTSHGPVYVSLNAVEGEEECKHFFPEGYKNSPEDGGEEEGEEELEEENELADEAAGETGGEGDEEDGDEAEENGADGDN